MSARFARCVLVSAITFAASGGLVAQHDEAPGVADATRAAFSFPSPLLGAAERRAFAVGNALFRANWVTAPASADGLDGLGPLFNARSCSSCHRHDGRSRPPLADERERHGLLVRIGIRQAHGPDAPHPEYGEQLQDQAVPGAVPECAVDLAWHTIAGHYDDGEPFELLEPRFLVRDLAHGPLGADAVLGGRTAPHLVGLGLLEAIPADALRRHADPDDRDSDGVSGRVHVLADGSLGRFGWKATQPTVLAQVAGAFVHDMGITSRRHAHEPLGRAQRESLRALPNGGAPEIDDHALGRVAFYSATLAVPAPRGADDAEVRAGAALFTGFGCAACHVPTWTTGPEATPAAFAGRTFHPYTDLLLHDLGRALADGKRDGDAAPSEWRTPPLWGLGLLPVVSEHQRLLHDGRARGFAEAILWHGGEAESARERFRRADRAQRRQLLAFLDAL